MEGAEGEGVEGEGVEGVEGVEGEGVEGEGVEGEGVSRDSPGVKIVPVVQEPRYGLGTARYPRPAEHSQAPALRVIAPAHVLHIQ